MGCYINLAYKKELVLLTKLRIYWINDNLRLSTVFSGMSDYLEFSRKNNNKVICLSKKVAVKLDKLLTTD